ncbi:MAG: hypothetical protein RI958_3253 [Actinomycetota bacterium]
MRHVTLAIVARRPALSCFAAFVVTVVASACGDDAPSTATYCGEVQQHLDSINTPGISSPEDIEATLEVYRSVADAAPIAIEPEWQVLISGLETAATVVPADPASMTAAKDAALAGQPAATRIQQYTLDVCGTAIGTPPPTTNPVTMTTVPDASVPPVGAGG